MNSLEKEPSWENSEGNSQLRYCDDSIVENSSHLSKSKLISKSVVDKVGSINDKPSVGAEGMNKLRDYAPESTYDVDSHIVAHGRISRKQEMSMSEQGFLKQYRESEILWLMKNHPFAALLLNLIAIRACRTLNDPDGRQIGEAFIGDHESIGATRGQYRHALQVLKNRATIKIIETCRTRKKATTGTTTRGTKVKLIDSSIWDINPETDNHRNNHPTTTEQPPNNHDQEDKNDKNEKKDHHPSPSSKIDDDDPFSKEPKRDSEKEFLPGVWMTQKDFDECVEKRGSPQVVEQIVNQIKNWEGRESEIKNWKRTILTWKIKNPRASKIEEQERFAKMIDDKYSSSDGWTARIYHDKMKDQRGILFEGKGAYFEPIFHAIGSQDFEEKVNLTLKEKRII